MADIEPEFDVEIDLPEFLSSVLDRTEECIHNCETDINDLQAQSVVLDRTISLLSSIALTDIEQDRIEWQSLTVAFAELLRAIENHLKTLAVRPSSISRRKCEILRRGNPGRPQFYISPETLKDLLRLVFSLEKFYWLFDVSRWTIYRRVQSYGWQSTANFSLLPDTEFDELVLEYMGRHVLTTGRTYLAGYLKSLALRIQRRRIREFFR